jgi:hypothetical protein
MGQTKDQRDEATIGELANLATSTATNHGVVEILIEANVRLSRQLEERFKEL